MPEEITPSLKLAIIQKALSIEPSKHLSVRLYGKEIGILKQTSTGNLSFTYTDNATEPISYSLPLEKKHFVHSQCAPFFNGLLPEGDSVRNTLAKMFHISATNDFSSLKAIGGDCAGALSFVLPNIPVQEESFIAIAGKKLTDDEWIDYIKALPHRPLGNTTENTRRLSLAGAQDKTTVTLINKDLLLPSPGTPSTHILKTPISSLEHSVLNEYLCMNAAKKCDIQTPICTIKSFKNLSVLLIQRYDREIQELKVKRIHQEDFCQALGILSRSKYQADGGPGFKKCAELLAITRSPAKAKLEFARRVMFNFLIGNNDAHAKNFSLIYTTSKPDLAPAYDLISTGIYPDITNKMAMYIGSSKETQWVNKADWHKFCQDIDISFPWFQKTFLSMAKNLPTILAYLLQETDAKYHLTIEAKHWGENFIKYCNKNVQQLIARLSD